MPTRLGIQGDSYLRPLFDKVRRASRELDLELIQATPAELALQLRQGELDGAFLSPIDYAREYSDYRILPGVACSSTGPSGIVTLVFNEQLHDLTTVAVDPRYTTDIVLLHLLLVEKYDVIPQIVPSEGSVQKLLETHDAVLVSGSASQSLAGFRGKIDLVDEWTDLTGLPFVHGFWVVIGEPESNDGLGFLSFPAATSPELPEVADDGSFVPRIDFDFGSDVIGGLTEFYRMAFYHGIIPDIPDQRFLPTTRQAL